VLSATWELPHGHVGRRVEIFDRLESTNTLAMERSRDPASAGLAILAREQTAGRGQFGRAWQAPAGSSVLLSVVLFPPDHIRRAALLTAWAAVSVCEVIAHFTRTQPTIKWPNDVLLLGKKVCGILIEQRAPGASPDHVDCAATVAGIGLNLRQDAAYFAESQLPLAGSLFSLTGRMLDTEDAARRLLAELDRAYSSLLMGDIASLERVWRDRLGLLGQEVALELAERRIDGKMHELAFTGVVLETTGGEVIHLQPEAVKHVNLRHK
jgi:BirA family transcriptional regulator, biotin operon repressor / biotin---[acetyl-CoA-carboxylase] ligase